MKYKVIENFTVAGVVGHKESNVSIGSSKLFEPTWMPLDVNVGDTIVVPEYQPETNCIYLKQGKKYYEIRHEPREFNPLEKQSNYNGLDTFMDCIKEA